MTINNIRAAQLKDKEIHANNAQLHHTETPILHHLSVDGLFSEKVDKEVKKV